MSVRDKPAAMISNDGFVAQAEYTVAARKNVGQSTAFVGITLHIAWQLDNICSTWKWNCFAGTHSLFPRLLWGILVEVCCGCLSKCHYFMFLPQHTFHGAINSMIERGLRAPLVAGLIPAWPRLLVALAFFFV